MKMTSICLNLAMLFALSAAALGQATLTRVNGRVTDGKQPVADAQVTFTNLNTGKTFKTKTGKDGSYVLVGLDRAGYQIEVTSSKGDKLYRDKRNVVAEGGSEEQVDIDVSQGGAAGGAPKISQEQLEKIKSENAKITNINALINQAQAAMQAQNWADAETALKQLTAGEPGRWEFYQALGNAQSNQSKYEEAAASYERGIQAAQAIVDGTAKDVRNADPVKAKAGVGQMLGSEGNMLLKLKKTDDAVVAFTKAAEMDPNPGVAYFNLCATQYNVGNMEAAESACTKAIAADPNKADAYFIKGSAMFGKGKMDANNKWTVPDGTAEALNKYLELSPTGAHANDVKQMLEMVGAKIETVYKGGKKK